MNLPSTLEVANFNPYRLGVQTCKTRKRSAFLIEIHWTTFFIITFTSPTFLLQIIIWFFKKNCYLKIKSLNY